MDDKRIKELEQLEQKIKARNKYLNDYQKSNYDRIICLLPKGTKEKIEKKIKENNYKTISDYIRAVIEKDLNDGAGAGSAIIPDYIPTKAKIVDYSAEVLAPGADDDIQPQAEKKPAQAATNSALESQLDRLLNDHT